jgi:hypothetical protein
MDTSSSTHAKLYYRFFMREGRNMAVHKAIRFSRSSNCDFQTAGGGRQNIHEYVAVAYSAN